MRCGRQSLGKLTNYQRGVRFEYEVIHYLKERDWTCIRSAGSHGPIDIVAIKEPLEYLIQCKIKYGMLPSHNIRELLAIAPKGSTNTPIYAFNVSTGMKGRYRKQLVLMNLHTRVDVINGEKFWQGSS